MNGTTGKTQYTWDLYTGGHFMKSASLISWKMHQKKSEKSNANAKFIKTSPASIFRRSLVTSFHSEYFSSLPALVAGTRSEGDF